MQFKVIALLLIHSSFFGDIAKCSSEKTLFQSEPVSIETEPWQVSVRLKEYDLENYGQGHICGGSVITQRVVLTAAHCVVNENPMPESEPNPAEEDIVVYRSPNEFLLVMGSDSLSEITHYTLQYQVLQLIVHEAFDFRTLVNNVAMFFINGYIPWNWPTVKAIPLNTRDEIKGILCFTTGWSITENSTSDQLKGNLVPIIDQSHCNAIYGDLTNDLICAGYEEQQQHSFCDGDSGGPLVCLGHLTGIILEGNSCALTAYPGLYVNVLHHYNWIVMHNKTFNYDHYIKHQENHILYDESLVEESFVSGIGYTGGELRILIFSICMLIYLK